MNTVKLAALVRSLALPRFSVLAEEIPKFRVPRNATGPGWTIAYDGEAVLLGFDEAFLTSDQPAAIYLQADGSFARLTISTERDAEACCLVKVGRLEAVSENVLSGLNLCALLIRVQSSNAPVPFPVGEKQVWAARKRN